MEKAKRLASSVTGHSEHNEIMLVINVNSEVSTERVKVMD